MAHAAAVGIPRYMCAIALSILLAGCQRSSASPEPTPPKTAPVTAPATPPARLIRATGTLRALKEFSVLVPQIAGQSSRLTLAALVPSGTQVAKGDVLAEFDRVQQLDNRRDAAAKYDDLAHQVEQKKAENRANHEKRGADMQQAKANLAKAELEVRKGPVLAEIKKLQAQVRFDDFTAQVASLEKSHTFALTADQAALRILELKRDRQKVALERAERNLEKLVVRAPLDGMVALENTWRNGTMGPPQEGDPMHPGSPLLRIFDPAQMEVAAMIGEPDGAALAQGTRAKVVLDAYPEEIHEAYLVSASPVASGGLGTPIRRFSARFRVEGSNPRLLPDMAAAVIVGPGPGR